ncbi:MAG: phosphopantetheine-binding protein [bacterium]|jgi:acyl carrier protein
MNIVRVPEENRLLSPLEQELAVMITETCRCTETPPADPSPDDPLIGPDSPFGLDSLDAVEIVVSVQRKYHVRIDSQETSRQVLRSLRTLAEFIQNHRK